MNLSHITDMTISALLKQQVILPSEYQKTFEKYAKNNCVDMNDDAYIANHNEESIKETNNLIQSANENIEKLSKNTNDAYAALKEGNTNELQRVSNEIQQLRNEMNQLKSRIYKDPLTGVNNRLWIGDVYLHGYETLSNNGNLIFIDLNKFKFINDTYGHHVGDKVLIYISHFLEKLFYDAHFVRFAGDEFLLIADNSDFDAINKRIEEARYELTQKKIKATNGDLLYLNFSFGTKAFKKGERFKEIIEQADALMYQHKNEKKS